MNTRIICGVVVSSLLILTACGGGSSSSGGGNSSADVTKCISVVRRSGYNDDISNRYTTYKNTCDYTVNLGYIFIVEFNGPFNLASGATKEQFMGSNTLYIACRPPSQVSSSGTHPNFSLTCT